MQQEARERILTCRLREHRRARALVTAWRMTSPKWKWSTGIDRRGGTIRPTASH
ncbi:MAG: hypothetical protein CM15mP74_18140 [Halieaceae bacterium]|nr:MAG: hypothetical protein CM15mP74_18140 [Halieaceae bacterium]